MITKKQREKEIEEREASGETEDWDLGLCCEKAALTQTNEIIKLIEKRIKFCKSQLKGDFEKNIISKKEFEENKIWDWRISGFEELLTKIKGGEK